MALLASPALGAPLTDTQLFKSGVSSFQKNHFPAATESFTKLLDAHPSSPLRDMTLYYLARSYLKTGNRQKAAQVTARLMREFPASYNTGTIDSELLKVVRSSPEASPPSATAPSPITAIEKPASPAGQAEKKRGMAESAAETARKEKTAKDKQALEKRQREKSEKKPAAVKEEQERVALNKVARERAGSEKRGKELLAARKEERQPLPKTELPAAEKPAAAQAVTEPPASFAVEASAEVAPSTDAAGKANPVVTESTGEHHPVPELDIPSEWHSAEAGTTVSIPFTIANRGSTSDRYRLKTGATDFPVRITLPNTSGTAADTTPDIAPGDRISGILTITIPSGTVDGFRIIHPVEVRSLSEKGPAVSREVRVVVSAPLLRAVVRTPHKKAAPGEILAYTVTILNVGSASATDLTVRLVCPPSYRAQSLSAGFRVMPEGLLLEGLQLAPGEARDLGALFRMDEVTADGEELVCRADIIDNRLNTRGSYLSGRIVAVKK